mgnify:CR=1 FL=1
MNDVDAPQFWEDIYLDDDAGWDLNGITPVFQHLSTKLKTGSVCFVGCGRGYDAVHFAKLGFQVTAVDFAPTAINFVKTLAKDAKVKVDALRTDIFSLTRDHMNTYDYIIEQTCFCAIHPSRRQEYERLVKTILKPNGKLIGLWFPLDKTLEEGGPPWGTTIEEVKSIFANRWTIEKEEFPDLSIESRKGREKLIIFRKENQS